ncbi:MAG: hypothetical protein LBN34_06515 [Clostridiales Family XIII bacterium]|jgi:hypothetical protein|nr:hypothetical protein [Clostridiales Family XIII bacterium]
MKKGSINEDLATVLCTGLILFIMTTLKNVFGVDFSNSGYLIVVQISSTFVVIFTIAALIKNNRNKGNDNK